MKKIIYIYASILLVATWSCKKFVQIDPPRTSLVATTVFNDDATATAALMGVYSSMSNSDSYIMALYNGLSADEFTNYSSDAVQGEFFSNSLTANNAAVRISLWGHLFQHMYEVNSIIEGINHSPSISDAVRQQLLGEAYFLRAFWNFYLANMFGDIPIIDTTLYLENMSLARTAKSEVTNRIITDITKAISLLTVDYKNGRNNNTTERVRPNVFTAKALLARVYLYAKNWASASLTASEVINETGIYQLESLDNVFLKSSREAIWQLMPVNVRYSTTEGNQFILTGTPNFYCLDKTLIQTFDSIDQRKASWTKSIIIGSDTFYYPFKYKIKSIPAGTSWDEYSIVIRLAELYLIRAEAELNSGNIEDAIKDINIIRTRAGTNPYNGPKDEAALRLAVERERRIELFTEWGHRWFDLIRTGRANDILSFKSPGTWQLSDTLYPIPQADILANPNLTQNDGY